MGRERKNRGLLRVREMKFTSCVVRYAAVQVRIGPLLSRAEQFAPDLVSPGVPEAVRAGEPSGMVAGISLFGTTPTAAFSNRRIAS